MGKLVVNGNSVYEVDENCMKKRKRKNKEETQKGRKNRVDDEKRTTKD